MNVVCRKLQISEFSDGNFEFMREFLKCLQPISETITVLEGDILYGHTLPALFTIEKNFEDLHREGLNYALPLLNALEDGFEKRYKDFLNPFNAVAAPYFLAMVSHPSYKLDCISTGKSRAQKIYDLLLNEAHELSKKNETINIETTLVEPNVRGKFFPRFILLFFFSISPLGCDRLVLRSFNFVAVAIHIASQI